ncbi:hypothetical protein BKA66DRAFT_453736 [Pyrenochaeta sp. MPI-SDFR-AT-0127]|nr:hypothetical protein BKA66DRAFT_453736 [Pyrenochaeta sp. MPI-SDFR-AT-0127]
MVIVAVAGGTGGVGRALVEAIHARQKHEVMILSRQKNDALANDLNIPIIVVDYSSVEGLKKVFEEQKIHTVISALLTIPGEGVPPEVNMIQAAEASKATERFIPSNWGIPETVENSTLIPTIPIKRQAMAALENSPLEYTVFYNGLFTDYYATPAIKTYLPAMPFYIDLEHNTAAIPGSGNTPIAFIHTFDLAKYVDLVLDFQKWELEYYVIGDKLTWNEFVGHAQAVKGTKFKIVYDSVDDLKKGQATVLPALAKALQFMPTPKEKLLEFITAVGLTMENGDFNLREENTLNSILPHITPLKVRDALNANFASD